LIKMIRELRSYPERKIRSILHELGRQLSENKDRPNAIKAYEALIQYPGAFNKNFFFLAILYYKERRFAECQDCLEKCDTTELHPQGMLLQLNLWRKRIKFSEIIARTKLLLQANKLQPSDREAVIINLGYVYMELYRSGSTLKDLFEKVVGYFEPYTERTGNACYGMVFLHHIAYLKDELPIEVAEKEIDKYLKMGAAIDGTRISKHYLQAKDLLEGIRKKQT